MIASLPTALEDRYTIEPEIGRGGLATLLLARDARHDRSVALERINPEFGAVLALEPLAAAIEITARPHPTRR